MGVSVQSNAGSRVVRISGQQLYTACSVVQCEAAGYPLHSHPSPSLPLPCVTVCHQVPNALYHTRPRRWKEVGGQLHAPAALPWERDALIVVQEAGWGSKSVWLGPKNLVYTVFRTPDRPAHVWPHRLRHSGPETWYLPKCAVLKVGGQQA